MKEREERVWRNRYTKAKLVVWTTPADKCYWHFRSSNGRIVCQGEGHGNPSHAERAAFNVIRLLGGYNQDWVRLDGP